MRKEYWIQVRHVDNRLVIFLNGETIWDSGIVHDDPDMDKLIEITSALEQHPDHASELIFEGFNDTYSVTGDEDLNPWHFDYRVFEREVDAAGNILRETELLQPYNERHLSNPNIRAINNSYQLVKKAEGFRVVANSLSQQFYQ
ncbi:MAG TPA: hypothetical protein PKE63_04685 [Lacibacter sp.]|nr:hypothetical protein [Lacibacter sp.]HMO90339.1 hypothetical protein [Lacibacter sp.]HMP86549.1 hypothetical protein [Lacibacter sp.]